MRRFYTDAKNLNGEKLTFSAEESSHISRVLRFEKGDEIIVCCGDGNDYRCVLTEIGKNCEAKIITFDKNLSEPQTELVLFQSIIKNEKMDYAIQKATEIGVSRIVPFSSERTVVRVENKATKKAEHWQKIAIEACKQCGRAKFPIVDEPCSFNEAIKKLNAYEQKIIAYEDEKTQSIAQTIKKASSCAYVIGPEGGFSKKEHDELVASGAQSVSLGKRILRAETAAVVCGAVILCLMGEMDV